MLHIYRIVRWLFTATAAVIIIPVGGEFFIDLAREHGFYEHPSEAATEIINFFISIADLPFLRPLALVLLGIVIGLWVDSLARKQQFKVEVNRLSSSEIMTTQQDNISDDKSERVIIDVTPDFLIGLHKNYMSIEAKRLLAPYIGKWIKVSGLIDDINSHERGVLVTLMMEPNDIWPKVYMHCEIEWLDRLSVIKKDTKISAIGQIKDISPHNISLFHGEILNSDNYGQELID